MSNPHDETATTAKDTAADSFLRRWSRRKQEARVGQNGSPLTESSAPATPEKVLTDSAPAAPEKVLTDADMPPIESLGEKSDFSMFLSPGVSDALRRRALRKLFTLPSVNQRCPLDSEYYDCHGYEPLGNIVTHEMREEMERAAQQLRASAAGLPEHRQASTAGASAAEEAASNAPTTTTNAAVVVQSSSPPSPNPEDEPS